MHLGDSIFIFILALVLFGPKKLPEMAKQIGKLMAEFRRASNDFRLQIDEELRTMERQEQQKKQEAERAAAAAGMTPSILPPASPGELTAGNSSAAALESSDHPTLQILPPSIGEQVSAGTPYAVSANPLSAGNGAQAEDHLLLHVDSIPDDPAAEAGQQTGLAAAEANAVRLTAPAVTLSEPEQAPVHNG